MTVKLREHDAYDSLQEAIDDNELSRHVSYVPAGELSGDNLVFTVSKVDDETFQDLIRGTINYEFQFRAEPRYR